MADYAYLDSDRTIRVMANQNDVVSYKSQRLYCRNPRCNARMFIHNAHNPEDAYFQAHGLPHHVGYCGCQGAQHFNRSEFDESSFKMPDAILNLVNHNDSAPSNISSHGSGERTNIYPPRTVRQIYTMCVNTPPDEMYNGVYIHDIIAGEDTKQHYSNGIVGPRIVECTFYQFKKSQKVILMNFPFHRPWWRHIELWFNDEALFDYAISYLTDTTHSDISVIAGDFFTHKDGTCYTNISSKRQLYRFRN